MSALDDAVAAFLATSTGHADPLTTATLDQCSQPGAPTLRPGWEDEPIDVPSNWRFLAVCALCGLFVSVLVSGCSTLPQPTATDADVPSAVQAACPPVAPTTRTDADAQALHAGQAQYAACRAALWHQPTRPQVGGMEWPLAPQRGQS